MRGYKNQSVSFSDSLTLTLSRGERGLLQHPPPGEGEGAFALQHPPGEKGLQPFTTVSCYDSLLLRQSPVTTVS